MSETAIYRQSHCASEYNWQPERPCLVEDAATAFFGVQNMLANKPKTKILVDGGDPDETLGVKKSLGFVDGQTTNPSLIAKNPEIQQRIASGHSLTSQEEEDEYRKIVQTISPLVGDAGVSIEVFADLDTSAEEMLAQGERMFKWIPNAYIKYPCTREGLRARRYQCASKCG
jgi:transaldolase